MAEGQEIPDQEGDAESQNSQPESPVGPSDTQREAKENLADKVDDNKVEAAGQRGGLKAALAARMASMSEKLQRFADEAREADKRMIHESAARAGLLGDQKNDFRSQMRRSGHVWYASMIRMNQLTAIPTFEIAAKVTGFLRDRLQPKSPQAKGPQAPSSK